MNYLIILAVSLLLCAVGFWRYIYFFSVGYGLSVAGIGAVLLILFRSSLSPYTAAACLLLFFYGLRLAGYLIFREIRKADYNRILKPENDRSHTIPMGVKLAIWISCGLLYFLQTSPVLFHMMALAPQENTVEYTEDGTAITTTLTFFDEGGAVSLIPLLIMLLGILIEVAADVQKSLAKRENPNRFVDKGLYRIVRCPNYLGELLLWTGVLLSGVPFLHGVFQWVCALLGYLGIIYVMFSGARRLELRQDRNYGNDQDYQDYIRTVPIMIPLIPLYSVKKHKWLAA